MNDIESEIDLDNLPPNVINNNNNYNGYNDNNNNHIGYNDNNNNNHIGYNENNDDDESIDSELEMDMVEAMLIDFHNTYGMNVP